MKKYFRSSAGRGLGMTASASFLSLDALVGSVRASGRGPEQKGNAMNRKKLRTEMAGRVVFVGCQFCGRGDLPLRNYNDGKICTACMKKKSVSNSDTK